MITFETLAPPISARAWRDATGHTLSSAAAVHGGLSSPGKMPCASYGLPAAECGVGSKLRASSTAERPTVCGSCYALKGQYVWQTVQRAQYRRLASVREALSSDVARDQWIGAMVASIGWRSRGSRVFRWHDSGDIQSVSHLELIADIAEALPWCTFWIPTRELAIVRAYLADVGPLPANLTVRMSAALVGHFPRITGQHSAVARHGSELPNGAHACPAYRQSGECGDCRACWSPDVPLVVYPLH
jgi:Gene product 88